MPQKKKTVIKNTVEDDVKIKRSKLSAVDKFLLSNTNSKFHIPHLTPISKNE